MKLLKPTVGEVGDYNSGGINASAANNTATRATIRGTSVASPIFAVRDDEIVTLKRGLYAVTFTLNFQSSSATGTRRAELWRNGALWDWTEQPGNGGGNTIMRPGPFYMRMGPGDRVAAYGNQSSGGAINISCGITIVKVA